MTAWTRHTVHSLGCDGAAPLVARVYRDAGGYTWEVILNGTVVLCEGWRLRLRDARSAAAAHLSRLVEAERWRGEDARVGT